MKHDFGKLKGDETESSDLSAPSDHHPTQREGRWLPCSLRIQSIACKTTFSRLLRLASVPRSDANCGLGLRTDTAWDHPLLGVGRRLQDTLLCPGRFSSDVRVENSTMTTNTLTRNNGTEVAQDTKLPRQVRPLKASSLNGLTRRAQSPRSAEKPNSLAS